MDYDLRSLSSIRHLAQYAAFASEPGDSGGAYFRRHAPDLSQHLKLDAMPTSSITKTPHVHLGIRHNNTPVVVFSGYDSPWLYEDFILRPSSVYGFWSYIITILPFGSKLHEIHWPHGPANARAHKRFLEIFDRLRGLLLNLICDLAVGTQQSQLGHEGTLTINEPDKVEVCGHGLGGALATLCALWCARVWPNADITCVTLGSPKVGDGSFAEAFSGQRNVRCYRLVVDSDPFPSMPCYGRYDRASAWHHVGIQIRLPSPRNIESDWMLVRIFPMLWEMMVGLIHGLEVLVHQRTFFGDVWIVVWILKLCQLLLNFQAHDPTMYMTSFQRVMEDLLPPEVEEGQQTEQREC